MELRKTQTGFAIQFPFALKEAFRLAFPSAKWEPALREWHVGPRSGKRLEAWAAECQEAAAELTAQEEAELTEELLRKVQAAIRLARENTRRLTEYQAQTKASRAVLETAQAELKQVSAEAEVARQAVRAEQAQHTEQLAQYINLDAVKTAQGVMARSMNPADRVAKQRFEEARQTVLAERNKLLAAGLVCDAISALAFANVNRTDRGHPRNIPDTAWFSIHKAPPQDE